MLCLFNGGICVVGFINVLPCGKERLQVGMYWSEIASVKGLKRYLLVHNAGLFLSGRKVIVYRRSYAVAIFDFTTVEDVGEYKKQPLAHGFGRDRKVGGGGGGGAKKKKEKNDSPNTLLFFCNSTWPLRQQKYSPTWRKLL